MTASDWIESRRAVCRFEQAGTLAPPCLSERDRLPYGSRTGDINCTRTVRRVGPWML